MFITGSSHTSRAIHTKPCSPEKNPTLNIPQPASSRDPDWDRLRTVSEHRTSTRSQRETKLSNSHDDTDLVIPARNIASREVEIQHVQSWAANNNLNLNCKKSYEIIFRKPQSRGTQDVPELPGVTRDSRCHTDKQHLHGRPRIR